MHDTTRTVLVSALALAAACHEPTAPTPPVLPEPDTVLDPARVVLGDILAGPCGYSSHLSEREEWAVVDVFFHKGADDDADGPAAEHIEMVEAYGGVVLRRFNVPAVRAWIRLDHVPALGQRGGSVIVYGVPDLRRYDYRVIARYDRSLRDSDVDRFEELGGRVRHRLDSIDAIAGALPDRAVPMLRVSADLRYVKPEGIVCAATYGGGGSMAPTPSNS